MHATNLKTTATGDARSVVWQGRGIATSDGAGVKLTRVIGTSRLPDLDPFLMLDEFGSDDPGAYIGGFPSHPHRGFETVTYMLAGRMRHRDSRGNEGLLEPGSVQWMTAASGLIHSEMPEQDDGLMRGFQLWVNLPAAEKMGTPRYQDITPGAVPVDRAAGRDGQGRRRKLRRGHEPRRDRRDAAAVPRYRAGRRRSSSTCRCGMRIPRSPTSMKARRRSAARR